MGGVPESSKVASRPAGVVDPFENEQRFILTRAQAAAFYAAIGPNATLELYDRERPLSYTRTTYLDTDDFAYLRSCEGVVAKRLRIREYASATVPGEVPVLSGICFLELKQHAGTARSKVRLSAPPELLQRLIDRNSEIGAFRASQAVAVEGMESLAAVSAIQEELSTGRVAPRLSTLYKRTCMSAEGGRVRITLDESLVFCRPQRLGVAGELAPPKDVIAVGPGRVLEIKHWGETPAWLVEALRGLSPAPSFSKFRVGMLALEQEGATPALPVCRTTTPAATLFLLTGPTL